MADSARIDVWLWAVRVYRTRSLATAACKAGHVAINGAKVKPSHLVRVGDEVRATLAHEKILGVKALPLKRGGAPEAALAVEDRTPPPPPKVETPASILRDLATGRPTKKDRRDITRLRGY
ncbi:RNA-binding S4 domain-containing protein [Amnibacterium kyonggiense]|uniref:Heat shock protein Hsp15 n=1 Tax=Amnibacterium kyonggiense TaxID=595671 RepID=A0A4R7FKU3_9MICO|nr:RNA-binding S4 domain-containing protein [Amnibacterium kyonggiense]TDS76975.1 heat shock protein Hsp15 [Amnibacterium kyonggiense]